MRSPPTWSPEQLEASRRTAIERFRNERLTEPLEQYLELFDEYLTVVEEFLEETLDLKALDEQMLNILRDKRRFEVFRYLSGPPVSEDDLKSLLDINSFTPSTLAQDEDAVARLVSIARDLHDRRRFPWLATDSAPTEAELHASALSTAALLAMRRLETDRRTASRSGQEARVAAFLETHGLVHVPTRRVDNLSDAPDNGQFCRESLFGRRKADFIIGLHDGRKMAMECKVSNSGTNSIKRLNNDAAVKAGVWLHDFGARSVVPAAMLEGVFNLNNLIDAQDRNLVIFWAHELEALADWIDSTRS